MVPDYLSDLTPWNVSDNSDYNLRNNEHYQTIRCKSTNYAKSFLPDTIKLWNDLPTSAINASSVGQFKKLIRPKVNTNTMFDLNFGSRFCQVLHCRLRLGCSDFNSDRYNRFISDNASCSCSQDYEDAFHYFFWCPKFDNIRHKSYFYVKGFSLRDVLNGNNTASDQTNMDILRSVHLFIVTSKRFDS